MKLHPLIKLILLCFAINLASCSYATKLGDKFLPDAEYNTLVVQANAAMHDGEWAKAAAFYEKAGQLKSGDWSIKLKQAQAYQNDGKLAQAFNTYQIIIDAEKTTNAPDDATLKTAKQTQAKLGFKNEVAITQVEEVRSGASSSTIESKAQDTPPVPEVVAEIPAAPVESLKSDSANQKPAQAEKDGVPADASENKLILDEVNAWAEAWAAKQLDAYFAHYVEGFAGDMANAKDWRESRKHKILQSKQIKIGLSELKVSQHEATAEVIFKQQYQSGNYQDIGRKTLEMKKVKGRWLIAKELFK